MFDFYKNIRLYDPKVQKSFSKLANIYRDIPSTKGCMSNISIEGGCGAWCCQYQTPQLLYCEFLYLYRYISKNFSNEEFLEALRKSMINSVDTNPTKGCIFFDKETKLCKCHKARPYNCRIYGITPPEEFNPRYEKLKEKYKYEIGAVIRPQCSFVSTLNGEKVTVEKTTEWWEKIYEVERNIGVKKELINDGIEGTYRTPHDHFILYLMPDNVIMAINGIRLYDKYEEKVYAVNSLVDTIRNFFKDNHGF